MKLVVGPNVITAYRRLDYSPWHAIAEFVDNSTQSYFDHRDALDRQIKKDGNKALEVSIVYDKSDAGLVRVVDNAMGMGKRELERALQVARPPRNTSGRSKYGMGMKTAACWLGNRWTVTTKKLGEAVEHSVTVDVTRVADGKPDGLVHSTRSKQESQHYTIVEVSNLHRTFYGRTIGKIGDFLRSMYRSDIHSGILRLMWRDQELSWEPLDAKLLLARDGKKYRKTFEFNVDEKMVHGWVGILDKGSRSNAGFSILQANRVIMGWPDAWRPSSLYGQLQGSNDLVNQRLVGEVHLDGFDVSHTKNNILWRGSQEEEVERELKTHCQDYREFAKKARKGGKDARGPSAVDVKTATDEIEKELTSPEMVDQIKVSVDPTPEQIESTFQGILDSVVDSGTPTLQGTIDGSSPITWKIYLQEMSPNDPYFVSDSTRDNEFSVIVNLSHPYFGRELSGPRSVLNYFRHCIYDSVAEWKARARISTIDPSTIKALKDSLLRVPMKIESHEDG